MDIEIEHGIAVIGDLVGSRKLDDRTNRHEPFAQALARVNAVVPAVQPLEPTVGDECQAVYGSIEAALTATLLVRLELGSVLDCRFGLGIGWFQRLAIGATSIIQDGSAWWSARDAIATAKARETTRNATLRGWCIDARDRPSLLSADLVNAYLLARDYIVGEMNARSRRLLLGTLQGRTQVQLAAAEKITQSAVSHNLRHNGAFILVDGVKLLTDADHAIDQKGRD